LHLLFLRDLIQDNQKDEIYLHYIAKKAGHQI
jgi:hypothetical protein